MASPILQSSARVLARLNRICPQVFPISNLQSNVPIGEAKLSSLDVSIRELLRIETIF